MLPLEFEETTRSGRRVVKTPKSRGPLPVPARSPSIDSQHEVSLLLEEDASKPNASRRSKEGAVPPSKPSRTPKAGSSSSERTLQPDHQNPSLKRKRSESDELELAHRKIKDLEQLLQESEKIRKSRDALLSDMDSKLLHLKHDTTSRRSEKIQEIIKELDDQFACALCFDVLAHPQTIATAGCGHSFCGLCILKWFFSKVHRECGFWHTSVDCPICRKTMVYPPDDVPRSIYTLPFTTNRLAESALTNAIETLTSLASSSEVGVSSGKGKGKRKQLESDDEVPGAATWRKDGVSRLDWNARVQRGRTEIQYLVDNWKHLTPNDFVALKDKYGV